MPDHRHKAGVEREILYYKNVIADMPQFTPFRIKAHLKLGQLYAQIGEIDAAVQEYSLAAHQYAHNGLLVKAIAVNKMIMELAPEKHLSFTNLGELYFQHEEYEETFDAGDAEQDEQYPDSGASPRKQLSDYIMTEEGEDAEIAAFLKRNPLFSELSWAERQWVEERVTMSYFREGACIVHKKDRQESLFVILEGEVHVRITDRNGQEHIIAILRSGDFFGEISLFTKEERYASVCAGSDCSILDISKPVLATLIKKHPSIAETLKEYTARRILDNRLANVPLFTHLPSEERQKIAEFLLPLTVPKGDVILQEGEIGHCMYLIQSGKVGVYTKVMEEENTLIETNQEHLPLATLQGGDFFGEQALLVNEPRNATIIALEEVHLLRLSKPDLTAIVSAYPRIGELLGRYHQQRTTDTLEALNTAFQFIAAHYDEEEGSDGVME